MTVGAPLQYAEAQQIDQPVEQNKQKPGQSDHLLAALVPCERLEPASGHRLREPSLHNRRYGRNPGREPRRSGEYHPEVAENNQTTRNE